MACGGGGSSPAGDGSADAATDVTSPDVGSADVSSADVPDDGPLLLEGGADAPQTPPSDGSTPPDASMPADGAVDAATDAGAPSLVALSVTGAPVAEGGPPAQLQPAFSPDIHDYTVRCAAGVNSLVVTMTASPGATSLLLQPTPSPNAPTQTLSVDANEGAAVVAAATDGVATVEYWVRCLPHDFPPIVWSPHSDAGAPPPGYTMIGTTLATSGQGYAMIVDSNGVPVWFEPAPQPGARVIDVDDIVPGTISFLSTGDSPSEFEVHQLSPLMLRYLTPTNVALDQHELRLLPNGDILAIASPTVTVDLTGMQIPGADGGVQTLSGPQPMAACDIVEFQPGGAVVWTWQALDHFDPVADSVYPEISPFGPVGGVTVYDPFHCNSIDVDPSSGDLLVSSRQMASIFYVERSSGRVLWKMGGATANKDGATYVSVADPFALQHDARLLSDWQPSCGGGSGHISLFDDEITGGAKNARGVVYAVTVAPNPAADDDGGAAADGGCGDGGVADSGATTGAATVSWQYAATTASSAMGSFRIRPDGSRVIGWGLVPGAVFSEVDANGHDLADLFFANGDVSYRALPAPPGAFDLATLRATAGLE